MSVILPGSYDPITVGHLEIIRKAAQTYDEVYVVAFINEAKEYAFSLDDRVSMLQIATEEFDNVLVSFSLGYVVDYMREHEIDKIVKGYRNEKDLEWEKIQAEYNEKHGGYETELIQCSPEYRNVSSTLVRERLAKGEDIDGLVPPAVRDYITDILNRKD